MVVFFYVLSRKQILCLRALPVLVIRFSKAWFPVREVPTHTLPDFSVSILKSNIYIMDFLIADS